MLSAVWTSDGRLQHGKNHSNKDRDGFTWAGWGGRGETSALIGGGGVNIFIFVLWVHWQSNFKIKVLYTEKIKEEELISPIIDHYVIFYIIYLI